MLTVKDVIDFLQMLPSDMEVPGLLFQYGGADHLNLAFDRQAVEECLTQAQREADEAYASWKAYKDAHRNIPVDSELFMETELIESDLFRACRRIHWRLFRPPFLSSPSVSLLYAGAVPFVAAIL
jgi:hypothetical protein